MLKILQARLKQYMNWELPHVQAGFRKGRGTRDQIANICWIIRRQRNSKKTHPSASLTIIKPLTVWITTNCGKHLEMEISDNQYQTSVTCLLRNLYAGQEAIVRTLRGTTNWLKVGKGVWQGCIFSPCLFNFCAEYIMWNPGLENHKLESRLPGEIPTTTDIQIIPL